MERWYSAPTTEQLRRGARTSVADLQDSINARADDWNHNPGPFT